MLQMTNLSYSAPGSWNDADIRRGRDAAFPALSECRAHYAVWCVLGSPLVHSADMRTVRDRHPECFAIMPNPEMLAVNQVEGALQLHCNTLTATRTCTTR